MPLRESGVANVRTSSQFPLSISPNGRYLVDRSGRPFLLHGDSPWEGSVQLTQAQWLAYLNDRVSRGFTAIVLELISKLYSSQTPPYKNANGDIPFTTIVSGTSVTWDQPVEAYWQHIDFIISECAKRGIVVIGTVAWLGFNNNANGDGWTAELAAATTGVLQSYGTMLGNRYRFLGNLILCMGGDYPGDSTQRQKQWNIASAAIAANPSLLVTGEPQRTDSDAWNYWGGGSPYTGFNLNAIYTPDTGITTEAATALARTGVPFIHIEGYYENENSTTPDVLVRQPISSLLSGCCGYFFGNNPIWGFGEPVDSGGAGAAAALTSALASAGTLKMANVLALFKTYSWWLLTPKTDSSLVSSSLGTGAATVCPALASDGSFAMILKNDSSSITVVMTNFANASVRAQWYDPLAGTYQAVSGSPFANTGSQTIADPGANSGGAHTWVLVLDKP